MLSTLEAFSSFTRNVALLDFEQYGWVEKKLFEPRKARNDSDRISGFIDRYLELSDFSKTRFLFLPIPSPQYFFHYRKQLRTFPAIPISNKNTLHFLFRRSTPISFIRKLWGIIGEHDAKNSRFRVAGGKKLPVVLWLLDWGSRLFQNFAVRMLSRLRQADYSYW